MSTVSRSTLSPKLNMFNSVDFVKSGLFLSPECRTTFRLCCQCVPDKSHTVDFVDFLQSQPCRIDFVACMYQPSVKLTVTSSMVCYCSPLITAGGWAPHTWTCLCRLDYVRGTIVLTICVSVSLMVRFTSNKDQNIPQWTICRPVTFLTLKDRDQRPESHENTEIVF